TGVTDASLLDGRAASYGDGLKVSTSGATLVLCNSLRIDPPSATVAADGTFVAHIVGHADVPVSGAAATITFDPALLPVLAAPSPRPSSAARPTPTARCPPAPLRPRSPPPPRPASPSASRPPSCRPTRSRPATPTSSTSPSRPSAAGPPSSACRPG